ncbi:zinc finger protein 518A-like [Amblyraja radiata]|uniref:zinc finger protein 518A-like n=1 Tax=Amblyraja radiata TaxID=386614 RepID=UPI00140289C6|nr:zinc finger protein 518A-like [Amblyraja radiata]XP_032889512.1 zinc finger protein 518A-like [Amblyraja radiata]
MPTGNRSRKNKRLVAQKAAQVSLAPLTVNKNAKKQLWAEFKCKLENSKVVLTRLDVKKISSDLLVHQSKTSRHSCQTARKSFRKKSAARVDSEVSLKEAFVQNSLDKPSKTSEGTENAILVKVLRFKCGKCKNSAKYNPKQLLKHYQEFHAADLHELCDFTANDFQMLSPHRLKHLTPLFKCEVCADGKMYTRQELRKHLNWRHGANGNFRCEKCRFSTKDQGTFMQHIHRHDVIQYKCGKCEHVSYTKGEFQRHLVVHTGSFPFCCQYCNYGATRKDYIVKHVNAVHKGLAEVGNSKSQVDLDKKGKVTNPLGLKLVLKRYKNGVTRKAQWRRKKQIQHLVTAKDNAKKSDATKKRNHPMPQSAPYLDACLGEEIIGPKIDVVKKNEICGPKLVTLNRSQQKKTQASGRKQISVKILPPEPSEVTLKNNKLSVPHNYSAQFMDFKVVNGKQHLVIKLIPPNKHKLISPNSQTQGNNTNLLHMPQNAQNSNDGISATNPSSTGARFVRLSNIFAGQPCTFLVRDHSVESKTQTVPHGISTVTNVKFTRVKAIEPLIAGMDSEQAGNLLLPTSSVRAVEAAINQAMSGNQIMQKIPTSEQSSVSNNYPSQIFVSSANSQTDSKLLQCLNNEQISKGKESDCDPLLQFKRGIHLPFIHNYASKQSGVSIVQGDDSKSAMILLPSNAVHDSKSGQPHKIVTRISSQTDVSSSSELCTSAPSQLHGFQKSDIWDLNKLKSPILLQMLKPSEVINGKCESRFMTSKDIPVVMSNIEDTSYSNSRFPFTSTELRPETLSLRREAAACDNCVDANPDPDSTALKDQITFTEQEKVCSEADKLNGGNYEPCLVNLNTIPAAEMIGKCQSELEPDTLKRDGQKKFGNDCEVQNMRSCTTVRTKCKRGKSNNNWSSSTDWPTCSDGNGKLENTEDSQSRSVNSTSSQTVLDYSGSNSEKSNTVDVEMMNFHTKDNMNCGSTEEILEEQASHSDGSKSVIMPRITSVFSLQAGDGISCLAPEENQVLLDALKATSTSIFSDETPRSESEYLNSSCREEQNCTHTVKNKLDLHNYSLKNNALQLDSVNDENNSTVVNNIHNDGGDTQLPAPPHVSTSCKPPNAEKLNILLKTHSDEIIHQQLIKDAIRTSANGNSNSALPPVTLLGPFRLAGISKPVLVQPSQKGSSVPLHLAKQSRLQMVSRGAVAQTKVLTRNSACLTDKGPGLILTFSNGTIGAVSNVVCGGNPPKMHSANTNAQGQTSDKVQQNTCLLISGSRVAGMETAPIKVLSPKDPLCNSPVSAVFDHHSYAKLAADLNDQHRTENGSLNEKCQGEKLIREPCENNRSSVSNNLVSIRLGQDTALEGVRDKNTENIPSQQTVLLQCIMQKKTVAATSEDNVANADSKSEESRPNQRKILLRFIKSSSGALGMKNNQYLKTSVSLHNNAAGNAVKPLPQSSQAVMLTRGSQCILLPVNNPVPTQTATVNIPLQVCSTASLKVPIPPVVRGSPIRSTEKRNTNKTTSLIPQRPAVRSSCIWVNEKSDELWEPRRSCKEKLVYRYSKRLKRKWESSEKSSKIITNSLSEFEEAEEVLKKSLVVSNATASRGTVQTQRLVPFDNGQLVKCPRRNQPVIVLDHPDADVPEVINVMKTIKKCKGNVLKVVLSKRTISALLHPRSSNKAIAKCFLINQCKRVKPVSPVKERYVLKLKLKKTSKNNYQIVKTVSNKAIEARFSCWFCGRIFDNQDEWVGHGQRHLMEATRDWNTFL